MTETDRSPIQLFFSYSHKDDAWRGRLETQLALLQRQGTIAAWHDGKIIPGCEWERAIKDHLESARIVLLLVSANFLASDYCWSVEVKQALERHARGETRVVPVILSDCDWHRAPFGKLLALPKDGKPIRKWQDRDEALADVARGIRQVAEELTGQAIGASAETGLKPTAKIAGPPLPAPPQVLPPAEAPATAALAESGIQRRRPVPIAVIAVIVVVGVLATVVAASLPGGLIASLSLFTSTATPTPAATAAHTPAATATNVPAVIPPPTQFQVEVDGMQKGLWPPGGDSWVPITATAGCPVHIRVTPLGGDGKVMQLGLEDYEWRLIPSTGGPAQACSQGFTCTYVLPEGGTGQLITIGPRPGTGSGFAAVLGFSVALDRSATGPCK